jgi:hypothetical protein
MARSRQTETRIATALHSCPALCTEIGLKGLARLFTCSKGLRSAVEAALCGDHVSFLNVALGKARSTEQQQHHQAVVWLARLLLRANPITAADVTQRLFAEPAMPMWCVQQLVSAGARITHAQLLAAANSMVKGVEAWVQAQHRLEIKTDIPAAAVAICCGDDWVSTVGTCKVQHTPTWQ